MIVLAFLIVALVFFVTAAIMYEVVRDKLIPLGLAAVTLAGIVHFWP